MLTFIGLKTLPNYLALSTDIEANGTITGATLVGKTVLIVDTGDWKLILSNGKLIPFSLTNGKSGTLPTFTSAEVGAVNATTVAVTFSENIVASDYKLGVTIKVAGVSKTIATATRQANHASVYYVIPTVTHGQSITWEYNQLVGGISSETGTVYLNDVVPQAVTNTV
jgi:hypothetical protein